MFIASARVVLVLQVFGLFEHRSTKEKPAKVLQNLWNYSQDYFLWKSNKLLSILIIFVIFRNSHVLYQTISSCQKIKNQYQNLIMSAFSLGYEYVLGNYEYIFGFSVCFIFRFLKHKTIFVEKSGTQCLIWYVFYCELN